LLGRIFFAIFNSSLVPAKPSNFRGESGRKSGDVIGCVGLVWPRLSAIGSTPRRAVRPGLIIPLGDRAREAADRALCALCAAICLGDFSIVGLRGLVTAFGLNCPYVAATSRVAIRPRAETARFVWLACVVLDTMCAVCGLAMPLSDPLVIPSGAVLGRAKS